MIARRALQVSLGTRGSTPAEDARDVDWSGSTGNQPAPDADSGLCSARVQSPECYLCGKARKEFWPLRTAKTCRRMKWPGIVRLLLPSFPELDSLAWLTAPLRSC